MGDENAAKWVPYYYALADEVVLVDDSGMLLSGYWRVAFTDDRAAVDRGEACVARRTSSWIQDNLIRLDRLPQDHALHRCDDCATGHGSVNAYDTPPARMLVGEGEAETPAYGCPRHPQSHVSTRDVVIDGDKWRVECCAICLAPFDAKAREALAKQQPEGPAVRRTILGWQRHVHAIAKSKGWHDGSGDLWKWLGNIHGEVSEAWEEARKPDFDPKRTYYSENGKPEGLGAELADIVIRAMDTAAACEIDLEAAIAEKSSFNETRPARHGGKRA